MPEDEIRQRVGEMLEVVSLKGIDRRRVDQLSGGQQQRVAIARALVNRPKVLLLDEPLGALDLRLRKDMQNELKRIQQQMGITFIYVTHDQEEALTMSDTVVVMDKGRIQQIGTPEDIYNEPKERLCGGLHRREQHPQRRYARGLCGGVLQPQVQVPGQGLRPHEPVDVVIRPEDIEIVPAEQGRLVGTGDFRHLQGRSNMISSWTSKGYKWLIQTTDYHRR